MSGGLVKHTLSWAKDNCPRAAFLSEEQLQERVQRAIKETSGIRFIAGIVSSLIGTFAAYAVLDAMGVKPERTWGSLWPGFAAIVSVILIFYTITKFLLHRRVRQLLE